LQTDEVGVGVWKQGLASRRDTQLCVGWRWSVGVRPARGTFQPMDGNGETGAFYIMNYSLLNRQLRRIRSHALIAFL